MAVDPAYAPLNSPPAPPDSPFSVPLLSSLSPSPSLLVNAARQRVWVILRNPPPSLRNCSKIRKKKNWIPSLRLPRLLIISAWRHVALCRQRYSDALINCIFCFRPHLAIGGTAMLSERVTSRNAVTRWCSNGKQKQIHNVKLQDLYGKGSIRGAQDIP